MPTEFDDMYEQLFGERCSKEGEAFERLAAVATAILFPGSDVSHDQRLRGQFSKSLYQVDVLRKVSGITVFGEAKDYTARGNSGGKVGRNDLQKLGGALPDVGADSGVFFSATDYTREARRYAHAAQDIVGQAIELMHARPSVETDMQGRVTKIVLTLTIMLADLNNATWKPVLAPAGEATLFTLLQASGDEELHFGTVMDSFFDANGVQKVTLAEVTANGYGGSPQDAEAYGCFWLPGCFIEVAGKFVEIRGLEYRVPFITEVKTLEIVSDHQPKILVKSDDGSVDRILTDRQLKQFEFGEDGAVRKRP